MVFPAITDLRVFQWGKESARASQSLTVDTQPTVGDTFTIGSKVYTFVAELDADADGEVGIGADLAGAQANIIAAINGEDGFNTPHTQVIADSAFVSDVLTIRAILTGTSYNTIATTETFTAVTNLFGDVTLLGGLSKGTPVAATSKMLVANWDAEPTDSVYRPPILRGLIQRNKGGEIVIERGTNWNIPDTPAFFEQLPHWASMSIRGGVVPSDLGAGDFEWIFERDPTGNPDLDSWTIERRLSNGPDHVDMEAAYSLIRDITFTGQQNQPVMLNANGFSRRIDVDSVLTPSLSAPTGIPLLASSSAVYIDTSWAGIGGTQIVGQTLNWQIRWNTGYAPLFTTDGRPDLDFGQVAISSENTYLEVMIRILVQPTDGQFDIEHAAAEAQTLRAIRIRCSGSSNRRADFDMILKHSMGSLFKIGEFEGQDVIEMNFVESTDATNLFRLTVVNKQNSLA